MVRFAEESAGDEALEHATGRTQDAWFAILDDAGATAWGHTAIARHLAGLGVPSWWAQGVTVRYEQARGMRLPGQKADGTFAVSATRTVDGPLDDVYARMIAAFSAAHGADPVSARRTGARPYARWSVEDGSVLVTVEPARDRMRVSAVHERLDDAGATGPAKEALQVTLATLSPIE